MDGEFIDKLIQQESKAEKEIKKDFCQIEKKVNLSFSLGKIWLPVFIFILALVPRLIFLFFVADPQNAGAGWFGDTYHHWQIAYLSKTVGFQQGFLRLWDLRGMEYFWGLLHPLFLTGLMAVTGSSDIIVTRLFSSVSGSLSVVLLFVIARRYWGNRVAWGAMLLAALNPVGVFNDASGMVEPLAAVFLLGGIFFWPRRPFLTGLMWGLASMARGEAWLFALGLLGAIVFFQRKKTHQKILLGLSYLSTMLVYMKYLLDHTGNPIYPLWWNFLGNAVGKWQADIPLRPDQQLAQIIFIAMFIVSFLLIAAMVWKKPRGWLLLLLGWGNFFFLGGFVGLTAYSRSYVHYFWVVRIFVLPYMILGTALAVLLLGVIPGRLAFLKRIKLSWLPVLTGWLAIFFLLAVSQLTWLVIWYYYQPTILIWDKEVALAGQASQYYQSGRILIPEDDPQFTYCLVHFGKISGRNIRGQMFDPFYYMDKNPWAEWEEENREIIKKWFKDDDIRLLVISDRSDRYQQLLKEEPEWFEWLGRNDNFNLAFYNIKQ